KPYQAELIRRNGFDVPATLVTTSCDDARAFIARHGTVVYKSVSDVRSVVTTLADPCDPAIEDVANAPTQFQAFVSGTDWRVHVVADDVFASEIECGADDYRFAPLENKSVAIRAGRVPNEVASRCVALSRDLGLTIAGIDLRRTDSGAWCCFE